MKMGVIKKLISEHLGNKNRPAGLHQSWHVVHLEVQTTVWGPNYDYYKSYFVLSLNPTKKTAGISVQTRFFPFESIFLYWKGKVIEKCREGRLKLKAYLFLQVANVYFPRGSTKNFQGRFPPITELWNIAWNIGISWPLSS